MPYLQIPIGSAITISDPFGSAACIFNPDQNVQFYGTSIDCLNGAFKCKSVSPTANATTGLTLTGLTAGSQIVLATNTVAVTGNVSMPGYLFAAGTVSGTKLASTGQVSYIVNRVSTGIFQITFASAHPLGVNYIVMGTAQGYSSNVRSDGSNKPTSTAFQFIAYTTSGTLTDAVFSFMVLAS